MKNKLDILIRKESRRVIDYVQFGVFLILFSIFGIALSFKNSIFWSIGFIGFSILSIIKLVQIIRK